LDATRRLVDANNQRPELYLRPVGIAVDRAIELLGEAGIDAEPVAFSPRSLRVAAPATALQAMAVVPSIVQDPAAALVVDFARAEPGATVLDLCAAPGGKAVGLADDGARVVAADLSQRRLARVRENSARLGLSVGLVRADGRQPPFRAADLVLLDAPCTGTGTLRRHPDGRWVVDEPRLASLVQLQRELLAAAAPLVREGGHLVYSTCSLEHEENEAQVEAFLAEHPDFRNDPATGAVHPELSNRDGFLQCLPHERGVDGSFAARLRRIH
jgi:16S rRNA (cytosine967-C5)-methyltransferase